MYGWVLRTEGWDTPNTLRFKCNADVDGRSLANHQHSMSLNRYEQAVFEYWERQPDEKRHWRAKIESATRGPAGMDVARGLERELWAYAKERSPFVPALRDVAAGGGRVSFLNLAELLVRLWGPLPKPKPRPKTG